MPCFTQVLTRQPVGLDAIGLGGAHRAGRQRLAQLRERRARRARGRRDAPGGDELGRCLRLEQSRRVAHRAHRLTRFEQVELLQHADDLLAATRPAAATIGSRYDFLEQAHRRHRRLDRDRVRFDEVDLHQRQDPRVNARARRRSRRARPPRPSATISAGISFDATEMTPRPPTAISGSVIASSPDSTMKSGGHRAADLAHLRDVAGGFLDADDVRDRGEPRERRRLDVARRCGPARCRRRSAAACSRRSRGSAGRGLPASACCSTA